MSPAGSRSPVDDPMASFMSLDPSDDVQHDLDQPERPRPVRGRGAASISVRPQVLESCSVALRRMGDSDPGTIAVTSTLRREGRSTVALGLAVTAAVELGRRTILLELDEESRRVPNLVDLEPGPGAADFLGGIAAIEDCIRPLERDLDVMPFGTRVGGDGIAKDIDRFAELVDVLGRRCDVLVADLPPLSSGLTTARMADLFRSVALVVRAGAVPLTEMSQMVSMLGQKPFVILNGKAAPKRSRIGKILRLRP